MYLIVGAFISGFSYYITTVNKSLTIQKFVLFIAVGVIFMLIGLFKLSVEAIRRNADKKELERDMPKVAPKQQVHHQTQHTDHLQHHAAHNPANQSTSQPMNAVKFCPNCGSVMRHFDTFCYKCGSRHIH
jgi:hypothetical protein